MKYILILLFLGVCWGQELGETNLEITPYKYATSTQIEDVKSEINKLWKQIKTLKNRNRIAEKTKKTYKYWIVNPDDSASNTILCNIGIVSETKMVKYKTGLFDKDTRELLLEKGDTLKKYLTIKE